MTPRCSMHFSYLFLIFLNALVFFRCSPTQLSGSEVKNERAAIYMPGGTAPAAYAKVSVVPVDYIPSDDEVAERKQSYFETTTDYQGVYTIQGIPSGYYNILAGKDSLSSYQDSVYLGSGSDLQNDTLDSPGSLTAAIIVQPNHNPRSATVQVLGTISWYSNVDSTGRFTLRDFPEGFYQLRIVTTQPEYTPTFVTVHIRSGKSDTLQTPIELIYTGVPVVTGLKAVYNPITSVIKVSWNGVRYGNLEEYIVYRGKTGSSNAIMELTPTASVKDTVFHDTLFSFDFDTSQTRSIQLCYQVQVRTNSLAVGEKSNVVDVTAVFSSNPGKLLLSDTLAFIPNSPFKLTISPDSSLGKISDYYYAVGNDSGFIEISRPETTFSINIPGDSVIDDLPCIVKVTTSQDINVFDTLHLQSRMAWEKAASAFNENVTGYYSVAFNGKMFVFTENGSKKIVSLWSSSDGASWNKEADSLPFSKLNKPPLIYKNKLWVFDRDPTLANATIWSSENASDWNSKEIDSLPNTGYSDAYEVWSTLGDKIVIVNYYPDCLQSGTCSSSNTPNSWSSTDGISWKSELIKNSLFPDRLDTPNKSYIAFESDGNLFIGGAWRSLYLTSPLSAAYSFREWNELTTDPVQFQFPAPLDNSTIGVYNPQVIIFKGGIYLNAQVNMESSTNIVKNTKYLWKLLPGNKWFLCSDTYPAVNNSQMKSNYHTLCSFSDKLYSISNAGVWVVR